jgi:anthraniloyl-CoA monooxygenase
MDIAIVGGGPAGLYFGLLAKKRHPDYRVRVYERNAADATYGWGVVFSDVGLAFLREADPEFFAEFTEGHERCGYMEIVHRGRHVQIQGNHFSRTARIRLLEVLQGACRRAGVELAFGQAVDDPGQLGGADLIVAADGHNSALRTRHAEHFQPRYEQRRNKFAWYGTHQLFHPVSLIFRETRYGVFIAHAYQYSPDLSTFLVEVAPETWERAGLHEMDEAASRRFCEQVFADDLGANTLLGNRSNWFSASIVSNERWHHGNIVLLGDALRTVHFSLGSGTRMAMQDAIALGAALDQHGADLPRLFAEFERLRRPASQSFQSAAAKSLDWYEGVDAKMDLDPLRFAYDYMRRTGQVSHEDLRERDPHFIAAVDAMP